MMEFTKGNLKLIAKNKPSIYSSLEQEMARQLLASMEQEPVGEVVLGDYDDCGDYPDAKVVCIAAQGQAEWNNFRNGTKLYAAPQLPQPAVVDADDNFYSWFGREWHENYQHNQYTTAAKQMLGVMAESAWRAGRRAAMLQGAEPVQGWIPCSERMPDADGNYWGWWSESKRQGPVWFIKSELQAQFQSSEITHWMPLPAAPQQEVHFKTTSDERLMKTPDITGETVKVIGSFNDDGFCHKHPDTPRLKHPYMQLMVYPPRPATYCPKCEPHVAEWEDRDKKLRKGKGV